MPKTLLPLPPLWTKCLTLMRQRHFCTGSTGSWSKALLYEGRIMARSKVKCHPKDNKCPQYAGECPEMNFPKCTEPDIKPRLQLACCCDQRLTEDVCDRPKRRTLAKKEKPVFKSMWETGGIVNECPNAYTPMDETHYKPSDKIKRTYTQTWQSCKHTLPRRKVCCAHSICMLAPYEKRIKQDCPLTAKEQDSEQFQVLKKFLTENMNTKPTNKCRKIVMPHCNKVMKNLNCRINRQHSDCLKDCCPHPSFSECDHSALNQKPPVECRCSHFESQCIANRYLIRKKIYSLPPALPAWPPKERPK